MSPVLKRLGIGAVVAAGLVYQFGIPAAAIVVATNDNINVPVLEMPKDDNTKSTDSKIDDAAWRAEVETDLGFPVANWEKYRKVWVSICEDHDNPDDWAMMAAVWTDKGDSVSTIELNLRHACPDVIEDFRAGVEQLRDTTARVDEICATDPDLRTEDDQLLAEAVGC